MPNGIIGVGYGGDDPAPLTDGAFPQHKVVAERLARIFKGDASDLFEGAMSYWQQSNLNSRPLLQLLP